MKNPPTLWPWVLLCVGALCLLGAFMPAMGDSLPYVPPSREENIHQQNVFLILVGIGLLLVVSGFVWMTKINRDR